VKLIKSQGHLIALDLLPMEPIEGVDFIQGDFTEEAVLNTLLEHLAAGKEDNNKSEGVDWVISDMAPNMSGNESVDIPRSMYLAELALDFALKILNPKGGFLIKVFQGEGIDAFLTEIKRHFKTVIVRKPKASRDRSREMYVLARELKTS
jgi:23S rRNA (uridine2552-2'-O)-methyltransferase